MTLQQKLDQTKERMAHQHGEDRYAWTLQPNLIQEEPFHRDDFRSEREDAARDYQAGFTAAAELLLPCAEALERYKFISAEPSGSATQFSAAAEALSTLERRLSEGGK